VPELEQKRFDHPDETRPFKDKGHAELLHINGEVVARATFEPGWRWSEHVGSIVGLASCPSTHFGYIVSGRQVIKMDDGTEYELAAGDVVAIPAGHDGWTVGDEPCVVLYFTGMDDYTKPR
jgi:quercetin dioxygenase-like cupin family protein